MRLSGSYGNLSSKLHGWSSQGTLIPFRKHVSLQGGAGGVPRFESHARGDKIQSVVRFGNSTAIATVTSRA